MTHIARYLAPAGMVLALLLGGCRHQAEEKEPWIFQNPYPQPTTLAVTVFLNQSGSEALDPVAVTDQFYTELQQVPGLQVIPVNRVLAALAQLRIDHVRGPEDAINLADLLGADGIIVGAITRYDPYYPPVMGMVVQLYSRQEKMVAAEPNRVEPWQMARAAAPLEMPMSPELRPKASLVRIYDARAKEVVKRLQAYAKPRGGDQSPYGWKKYTTRANYLGFVSHEIIGELLTLEQQRLALNRGVN